MNAAPWTLEDYGRFERGLLAFVALAASGLAALHLRSEVARDIGALRPVRAVVLPRDGGIVVIAQWEPAERRLKALALPADTAVDASMARTLGQVPRAAASRRAALAVTEALFKGKGALLSLPHWVEAELPGRTMAAPDFILAAAEGAARRWTLSAEAAWRLSFAAARVASQGRSDLSAYDLLLLAAETLRCADVAPAAPAGRRTRERFEPAAEGLEELKARFLGDEPAPAGSAPTAEVLNATGRAGLALDATKVLRWRGVDVVQFANSDDVRRSSLVIDRTGRRREAEQVRRALGLRTRVLTMPDPSRLAQVSVLVGDDFSPSVAEKRIE